MLLMIEEMVYCSDTDDVVVAVAGRSECSGVDRRGNMEGGEQRSVVCDIAFKPMRYGGQRKAMH